MFNLTAHGVVFALTDGALRNLDTVSLSELSVHLQLNTIFMSNKIPMCIYARTWAHLYGSVLRRYIKKVLPGLEPAAKMRIRVSEVTNGLVLFHNIYQRVKQWLVEVYGNVYIHNHLINHQ